MVGAADGFEEGSRVGCGVLVVGAEVGDAAGEDVGARVGLNVKVPHSIPQEQGQALTSSWTCCSLKPIRYVSRQSNC